MVARDLTGQLFTRLLVLRRGDRQGPHVRWLCLCQCEKRVLVRGDNLRAGHSGSCGCLVRDRNRERLTTHGLSASPEYISWRAMLARCLNPNHPYYHDYGGRGILICSEWLASFEAFYAAMGPRPEPKRLYSLDRLDPDGHYEKVNCRWATAAEQAKTKRPRPAAGGRDDVEEDPRSPGAGEPRELTADEWAELGW